MSILQAMFSGSSALINFGEAMTVIGNNLANANTTSFKASSTSFQDVLMQTVGRQGSGIETQVGTGVGLAAVSQDMAQGSFTPSANVTDLSIDGTGFFKVRDLSFDDASVDSTGKPEDTFYTRAGGFKKDVNGDLVNAGGLVIQGWELDEDGNQVSGGEGDVNFTEFNIIDPTATTLVEVGANLDSSTTAIDQNVAYDPDDATTYDYATPVRVIDTTGTGHVVELQFRKLPLAVDATARGGNDNNSISFDLSEDASVDLTFTPVNGGTAIESSYSLQSGNNVLSIENLGLEDDTMYNISHVVTDSAGAVSSTIWII